MIFHNYLRSLLVPFATIFFMGCAVEEGSGEIDTVGVDGEDTSEEQVSESSEALRIKDEIADFASNFYLGVNRASDDETSISCPKGQAATGIWISYWSSIQRVQLLCAKIRPVTNDWVKSGAEYTANGVGTSMLGLYSWSTCSGGRFMVGLTGTWSGNMRTLKIKCSTLKTAHETRSGVRVGVGEAPAPIGNTSSPGGLSPTRTQEPATVCKGPKVVTALKGRTSRDGATVYSLQPGCSSVIL